METEPGFSEFGKIEKSVFGFWMKNTLIPLSIAFYNATGTIVDILDMEPCPEEQSAQNNCPTYTPDAPYWGALEVNKGSFDRWGFDEGDQIIVAED